MAQQVDVIGALPPVHKVLSVPSGGQHLKAVRVGDGHGAARMAAGIGDDLFHVPALVIQHGVAAGLDDARLLSGDLGVGVPQLLHMLQADVGDHRHLRRGDHIGGVQPSAQAHLQHHQVTLGLPEIEHAQGGHQLELGGGVVHLPPG